MTRFTLPALCLALAACQPLPPDAPRPGGHDLARCGGIPVGALMGQHVSTLPTTGGWTALRVITPGMAVTEDFSPTRLNVGLDNDGLIIGVACG